jgi:CheY-like chemotaxis protein
MLARLIGEDIEFTIRNETADADVVRADPAQIEQVVMNLAVNARDAMPSGGRLELAIGRVQLDEPYARTHPGAKPGEYVAITVTDTGTGMSEDIRAHAFEPFFTTKEPGTGLGLSTVYGIVKQNEGYVWIDSEEGRGTVVSVYLPRRPGEPVVAEPVPDASPEGLNGAETVLVVEDEGRVARLAARILGRFNYTVVSAASGEEALGILSERMDVHLVVSDLVMSGMDGLELCRRLASLRPALRVLLVSGYNDRAADIEQSGYAFLGKPYTPLALARKVRTLLDS